MKKAELVQFLKDEHRRIEDALYQLGEIRELKKDPETINNYIRDRFSDALMYLNHKNYAELEKLLERAKKEKWL